MKESGSFVIEWLRVLTITRSLAAFSFNWHMRLAKFFSLLVVMWFNPGLSGHPFDQIDCACYKWINSCKTEQSVAPERMALEGNFYGACYIFSWNLDHCVAILDRRKIIQSYKNYFFPRNPSWEESYITLRCLNFFLRRLDTLVGEKVVPKMFFASLLTGVYPKRKKFDNIPFF